MTGGGSSTVAFVKESSFQTEPGTPTYYLPGRNVTVDEANLQNTLQRLREPDTAEAVDSLSGNLEGAFSASWAMSADTHADVRDIVFNDAGGGFTSGLATTSSWYLGLDYIDGTSTSTVERNLTGCIPLEYSISYDQGTNTINESLTMGYADETKGTTITPSSISGPTDGSEVPFHGFTLDVDAATVNKLQSATLSFSNIARFQRGTSRTPVDAIAATPQVTLDASAIYNTDDYLELAYGASGSTSTQDNLTNVTGTVTLDSAGTTVATYSLPKLKPDNYDWSDLVNGDTDTTDPVTYHVNGGVSIS